ncbi:hypothetical protein CLD22_02030 [Rubrivivax gelatinosus]|nr:hypothetical protein [Rubrivivax gelatinosus]
MPDAADFGLEKRKAQAVVEGVDSVIPGPFDGWGPKTVWRLANGQTWRVVDGSRGVYSLRDPAVHIRRGLVGNYVMEIQGVAQLIKVRRIE